MLRPLPRLALAITVTALAGCGRGSVPPARVEHSAVAAAPAPPPRARDSVRMQPRGPGDRCRREPGQPPRPLVRGDSTLPRYDEDIGRGLAFRCTLREGGRPVRVVLRADTFGIPESMLVYDATATAAPDTLPVGKVPGEAAPPYLGATLVEGEDLDDDGWTDVRVMTSHGTGGRIFDLFRYDPRRGRFAKDTVLSGKGNLHREGRCARTSWRMGAATRSWLDYCWRDGRWVATRGESWEYSQELGVYIHQREELRGGRWRVVSADTSREEIGR